MEMPTIAQAAQDYLETVRQARSENTARTYSNALSIYFRVLKEYWIDPENSPVSAISEDSITKMLAYLKNFSSATERLYLQAVKGFYEYLTEENLVAINLPKVASLIKKRSRHPGQRLPQFPSEDIERVLEFAERLSSMLSDNPQERLRAMRDRAFLITLADTGLRVHEACNLKRAQVDWNEGRALVLGKGNKEAIVRLSRRSLRALRDYISARAALDGASGHPLPSLPLFARHDKGAGKKVKPITTTTGRNIVTERVHQALGDQDTGQITPHSFRHYFVTVVLRGSGNLKLAQELARHANIQVTQRYAHLSNDELDRGYHEIFEKDL